MPLRASAPARPAVLLLPLLLTACVVSQQGNRTIVGFDTDELTSNKLQTFQLGAAEVVLRRTASQQYQIKLYDRMKLIDLGRVEDPRVADIQRLPGYDLIAVHTPTRACPYAHQLYELSGYQVGMWSINSTPGKCSQPLRFSTDGKAWMAQQEGGRADGLVWFWSEGRLTSMLDPAQAERRNNGSAAGNRTASAPRDAPSETGAPPAAASAPVARAGAAGPAPAAKPRPALASQPATPASGRGKAPLKPLDAGRYAPLPDNGVTEIAPAKVTLHDVK